MDTKTDLSRYDVIVVGGGNAALCAALSARDEGARVLVLERASIDERGGNSAYTDGLMRFAYDGADDIRALAPDLTDQEMAASDFGSYTESDFFDDMARITQNRTDPDLCEILVKRSKETLLWMRDHGVRFMPNFGRQAFKVDNKFKFWGGATIAVSAGGPGLIDALYRRAEKTGIEVIYNAWARELIHDDCGVSGVIATVDGKTTRYPSKGVILACGSFEANAEWRVPAGSSLKCAVRVSILATDFPWRLRLVRSHTAIGPAVILQHGSAMPPISAISRSLPSISGIPTNGG